MKKASLRNNNIIIKFDGSDWKDGLAFCKSGVLIGISFNSQLKEWNARSNKENILALEKSGFELSKELFDVIHEPPKKPWKEISLGKHLNFFKPFQKEAYQFLEYHNNRALISISMGGGKSILAWQYIMDHDLFPALFIAPVNVLNGLEREYHKWFKDPISIKILQGYNSIIDYKDRHDVLICNPELFSPTMISKKVTYPTGKMVEDKETGALVPETRNRTIWQRTPVIDEFLKNKFKCIVLDELHFLQEDTSAKYQAISRIAKNIPAIIGLTGTPLDKAPAKLFPTLNFIRPDLFPSKWPYMERYCAPKFIKSKGITTYTGATNTAELHNIIVSEIMYRATEEEVNAKLPPKQEEIIVLELNNPEGYKRYEKFTEEALKDTDAEAMQIFGKLSRVVYTFKKEKCFKFVDKLLEDNDKIILFAHNKNVITDYKQRYKGQIVSITGETAGSKRQGIIDNFVTDPNLHILIGNYKSLGVALDGLQKCCTTCVFIQLPFSPGKISQAYSRILREGQKRRVYIFYLIGKGTIEEDILDMIDIKKIHSDSIIDGKNSSESSFMKQLFIKFKKRIGNNNG